MAGLLDFLSTPEGRLGMGLLAAAGPSERPLSFGQRLQMGMQTADDSNNQLMRQKLMQSQVDENASQAELRKLAAAKALAAQEWRNKLTPLMQPRLQGSDPVTNQIAQENNQFGDFGVNSAAQLGVSGLRYGPDNEGLQRHLMDPDSPYLDKIIENRLMPKEPKYQVVGGSLVRTDGEKPIEAFRAPEKSATPGDVLQYQFAQKNDGYRGSFTDWLRDNKRAGASSVMVNTDNLGLKPKDRFEMEGKLQADYSKATTDDSAIVSTAADISNILDQPGSLKDQAAIYKFAKALDPQGAVREADYAAIVKTSGGLDYITSLVNKAITGEQLSPKQRTEMKNVSNAMAAVGKKRIAKQQAAFAGKAKMYNLKPENVFNEQSGEVNFGDLK